MEGREANRLQREEDADRLQKKVKPPHVKRVSKRRAHPTPQGIL